MTIQEKMNFMYDNYVISWHEHIWRKPGTKEMNVAHLEQTVGTMKALGFDQCVMSLPLTTDKYCPPEEFISANNLVYDAIQMYPGKFYGMAFVNPGFRDEALREVERCVKELGFVGVKLYHQYFMDDPTQFPLVEKCIELDVPILMHCGHGTGPTARVNQPRCSDGVHMANIAKRYPEGTFIMAHTGGGGDWRWSLKAIEDCPNVYLDIAGSVHDRPQVEEAYRYVGVDRMLFATDGTWCSGVAKILGADIPEEDKKKILAGAALSRFLERGGK